MSYAAGMSCPEQDAGNNSDILDAPIKQVSGLSPRSGERGMNLWNLVSIQLVHPISMAARSVSGGMERGRLFLLPYEKFQHLGCLPKPVTSLP